MASHQKRGRALRIVTHGEEAQRLVEAIACGT
jgi:hypothetical protein